MPETVNLVTLTESTLQAVTVLMDISKKMMIVKFVDIPAKLVNLTPIVLFVPLTESTHQNVNVPQDNMMMD